MCLMRLLDEIGDIPLVMLTADRIENWVTTLRNKSRGVPRTRPRGKYVSLYTQHGKPSIAYAFYVFGGVALGYSVLQFKRGNLDAMIKGFMGAALLFLAPTLLDAIIGTL